MRYSLQMNSYLRIERILIHPDVVNFPLTKRVLKNCGRIPFNIAETVPEVELTSGKRILFVTDLPGQLVKPCPATSDPYLCCQYTVLHSCLQCPMDCVYCILQQYLESPVITLNVRLHDMLHEINSLLAEQPRRFFRFGTGELGDSLALDPLTKLSEDFIRFFSDKRNAIIELKTKSIQVQQTLRNQARNAVISWSVNPDSVIQSCEFYAPSLSDRLHAARQCEDKGYLIGFHFDPIVHVPDWESLYESVVENLFKFVSGDRIAWISLGTLRFPPALKAVIQKRFPGSNLVYEEMIRGMDGKMRYPKPLRISMYQHIYNCIRTYHSDVFVYFCMESPQVWDRVTGRHPGDNAELDYWFADSLWKRFGSELAMDEPRLEDYVISKK